MSDFFNPETFEFAVAALLPGFMAFYAFLEYFKLEIPSPFITFISSVIISFFYNSVFQTLVSSISFLPIESPRAFADLSNYILFPAVLGFLLAIGYNKTAKNLRKIGIPIKSPVPTAWTHIFSNQEECWITVRLKEKTGANNEHYSIKAWYSGNSFVSSDTPDRDLYLENVHEYCEQSSTWKEIDPPVAMWVPQSNIYRIEFCNGSRKSNINVDTTQETDH